MYRMRKYVNEPYTIRFLQLIGKKIKKAIRFAELIFASIRLSGGLYPLYTKILLIWKMEGFTGIKRISYLIHRNSEIKVGSQTDGYDRNNYREWIKKYDLIDDNKRLRMKQRVHRFVNPPLISIIMPTFNPNLEWLKEAIVSVKRQIYSNWELCIADDASIDAAVHELLEDFAKQDKRIKIVWRNTNGHISAASNSALTLATGEWIALFDQDDLLSEHALYFVADKILKHPDAKIIYSDEDKIDKSGRRYRPYFKCDWNPDLFYSQNMITHLCVYQKRLVEYVGGFRLGFEGAQDYDLALRCVESVEFDAIIHIPRVLYHWRAHQNSTASSAAHAKPYAMAAGERALNEHFQRRGLLGMVELMGYGYRARYALPEDVPYVSLIIVGGAAKQICKCIQSVLGKTDYRSYEIIIVDNYIREQDVSSAIEGIAQTREKIKILRTNESFNYAAANNAAVRHSKGEIIGLLSSHVEVISSDWITEMASHALRPEIGAVGAKLLSPDQKILHGGVVLGIDGFMGYAHSGVSKYSNGYYGRLSFLSSFSAVSGACLLIRKSVYFQVDGMDEENQLDVYNDIDFCLRVRRAGYRNLWTPYAQLYQHVLSEKPSLSDAQANIFRKRWNSLIISDPAYNPNLTLEFTDFSLAWPPRVPVTP